jgi:hypothetical protein
MIRREIAIFLLAAPALEDAAGERMIGLEYGGFFQMQYNYSILNFLHGGPL